MVKSFSREPPIQKNAAKSRAYDIRVHFKNTFNVGRVIRGMGLTKAQAYLKAVLNHKRCVPFVRYNGGVGRTAQSKEFDIPQGRWPEKSVRIILDVLQNLEANANVKNLDAEKLVLSHVQINRAPKGRRRTYRAHGRINPFMNNPCHVEIWANLKEADVKKEQQKEGKQKVSKKQIARRRVKVGEN